MKALAEELFRFFIFRVLIPLTSFSLVIFWCDKKEILNLTGNLTELWTIPAIFLVMASNLSHIYEIKMGKRKLKSLWWVPAFLSKFAMGAWMGLSLLSLEVLERWYHDPGTGSWEPLFTANGLSTAGVLLAARSFETTLKKYHPDHDYITRHSKPLNEAATEIQRLLKQLEETNPTTDESEKIAYINIATKPGLKQRVIAALRSSGETAIDELVLEDKYLNVGKAALKGWISQNYGCGGTLPRK